MLEIYFSDLKKEAQKEVLDLYGLKSEKDGNFETCPLFVLDCEEEWDEDEDCDCGDDCDCEDEEE